LRAPVCAPLSISSLNASLWQADVRAVPVQMWAVRGGGG
jgi:hypothetical protein